MFLHVYSMCICILYLPVSSSWKFVRDKFVFNYVAVLVAGTLVNHAAV